MNLARPQDQLRIEFPIDSVRQFESEQRARKLGISAAQLISYEILSKYGAIASAMLHREQVVKLGRLCRELDPANHYEGEQGSADLVILTEIENTLNEIYTALGEQVRTAIEERQVRTTLKAVEPNCSHLSNSLTH
ncbi:hypothetical protein ACKFKG_30240 [Phormidesmis sp. 146-35]